MSAENKRILIIVENLPVPLDRRVWQEACALRNMGHSVTVICPQMRGFVEPEETLEGIKIYRHPISGEASGILGFFMEYTSALWGESMCALKAWRKGGFDVIHLCNPPDILFLIAFPYKLFAGVKVLYDVHDIWPEMFEAKFSKKNPIYWAVRFAERCTLALADVVIATNQTVLNTVVQRGNKKQKDVFVVRTSPNAIDLAAQIVPERKNGRRYLVGYIGVMGDADGVDYLLNAIAHIVHQLKRSDIQFDLMGSGPEWEKLNEMRKSLRIEDYVTMEGRVSDQYLCETLQTMDMGVGCDPINSYNDHCTMNKTLEYMAFGKPQVLFGINEGKISAGDAAVYVDENCPIQLGDAIVNLLDNLESCRRLGEIGRERIKGDLSWSRSVDQLKLAYQRALND